MKIIEDWHFFTDFMRGVGYFFDLDVNLVWTSWKIGFAMYMFGGVFEVQFLPLLISVSITTRNTV